MLQPAWFRPTYAVHKKKHVNVFVCMCVNPVDGLATCHPTSCPGQKAPGPQDPAQDKQLKKMDGWMDFPFAAAYFMVSG